YLAKVDANVILINYRGYGKSDGSPKEADLKADALKIFDRVARDHGLDPKNCGAWGRSLGSSIASHLAMERGIGRLILTCPFDSIEAVAASYYPAPLVRAALSDKHRTTDFSPEITASTLILAASDDEVIPAERTRALYDSLTCPKTYTVIPDTGHNTISEGPGYYDAVNRFLQE
ncbi:MAG: lysophospholipase, partial [Desulfobacterales bacterium]|nr:lysophospholipase [Desulfobacterales bacterium]